MKKWLVGALLLGNVGVFAYMQWGKALTVDSHAQTEQGALHAEKIKLLEAAAAPQPKAASAVATTAPPAPVSAVTVPIATHCMEWGDFSGDSLSRAEKALATLKLGTQPGQRNVEHINGYWVYIPPIKVGADVEKKVAQLKARGVSDYFVVQDEGKWLNAISLGVFKTQEAAQKYLTSLKAKDVRTAQVGEHFGKEKFTVFELNRLDPATLEKLQKLSKEFADTELKTMTCH